MANNQNKGSKHALHSQYGYRCIFCDCDLLADLSTFLGKSLVRLDGGSLLPTCGPCNNLRSDARVRAMTRVKDIIEAVEFVRLERANELDELRLQLRPCAAAAAV